MTDFTEISGFFATTLGAIVLGGLILWSALWKGLALYRAGKRAQPGWFVVLFLVNTLGLLEILYLVFFSRDKAGPRRRR
jgi:methionyl-tRNA synthetase